MELLIVAVIVGFFIFVTTAPGRKRKKEEERERLRQRDAKKAQMLMEGKCCANCGDRYTCGSFGDGSGICSHWCH
ncbi:MAG: hypothetical protein FWH07_08005 [Oscillospiraceae bacterium]|nr:hypothetical protein [Oscillospiraceae bacterium]